MLCGCDVTFGRSRIYDSSSKVAIIPTIFTEKQKSAWGFAWEK